MKKSNKYPGLKGFSKKPVATVMRKDSKYYELYSLLKEDPKTVRFVDIKHVNVYHTNCNANDTPCRSDLNAFVSKLNKMNIGKFGIQMRKDKNGKCLGWEVGRKSAK